MNSTSENLPQASPLHNGRSQARATAAYTYLRTELLNGALVPGDKLSVVELTERLACSRAPVMEALKKLEGDGFVVIVPQVGCSVVEPAIVDVQDFFTLFASIEGTVTAFAAERRSTEEVERFRILCRDIDVEAEKAGGPGDNDPTYRRLNLQFHSAIHQMAHSPASTKLAASLWDRSDFYIKLAFGSLYFSGRVNRSHRAIRKAIINGDSDAARRHTETHLLAVGGAVVRTLAKNN